MEHKLQNIILPLTEDLELKSHMFYRGMRGVLDREGQKISFPDNVCIDFATYFNGCSYGKWKEYTDIEGAKLRIRIKGTARIALVGYTMNSRSPVKKEFASYEVDSDQEILFEAEYPENNSVIIGFEVNTIHDVTVYGGGYYGIYGKEANEVTLSICTTTCRKEEYITKNVKQIQKWILEDEADSDIREHLYLHVVDNGRTLDAQQMSGWHVTVHPNKNTGGSGGYARGMIEAMAQTPKATHVLLMDDDVLILPESIKRTYRLFQLVNEKHKDALISGAMLLLEDMDFQHEDVGSILTVGHMSPPKGFIRHNSINAALQNEMPFFGSPYTYAAWWYCGIPMTQIEKNGLPMPYFIRVDDVEYGRRLNTKIMSMNGIGLWHIGFFGKYNAAMDVYHQFRNMLISMAIGAVAEDVRFLEYVEEYFQKEMEKFNYICLEMMSEAFEDYLKGPDFIEKANGEEILVEHSRRNEKYVSLNEIPGVEWELGELRRYVPRGRLADLWVKLTAQGHRFWPEKWLNDEPAQIMFNYIYTPERYVRRKTMYAINPETKVVAVRTMDRRRYRKLARRWKAALRAYKKNNERVKQAYLDRKAYLTSMEFWTKYLEIGNS